MVFLNRSPAVARNLHTLFDPFGPFGRKIYGLPATRVGAVRWPVHPFGDVLILSSYAL